MLISGFVQLQCFLPARCNVMISFSDARSMSMVDVPTCDGLRNARIHPFANTPVYAYQHASCSLLRSTVTNLSAFTDLPPLYLDDSPRPPSHRSARYRYAMTRSHRFATTNLTDSTSHHNRRSFSPFASTFPTDMTSRDFHDQF